MFMICFCLWWCFCESLNPWLLSLHRISTTDFNKPALLFNHAPCKVQHNVPRPCHSRMTHGTHGNKTLILSPVVVFGTLSLSSQFKFNSKSNNQSLRAKGQSPTTDRLDLTHECFRLDHQELTLLRFSPKWMATDVAPMVIHSPQHATWSAFSIQTELKF